MHKVIDVLITEIALKTLSVVDMFFFQSEKSSIARVDVHLLVLVDIFFWILVQISHYFKMFAWSDFFQLTSNRIHNSKGIDKGVLSGNRHIFVHFWALNCPSPFHVFFIHHYYYFVFVFSNADVRSVHFKWLIKTSMHS